MTQSMTAFSRGSEEQDWGSLVWEIRSVNHRYLDVIIKLPEELRSIENEIRTRLSKRVNRGKLECSLRYKANAKQLSEVIVNESYAEAILKACQKISKRLHQPSEMHAIEVLKWPGVVEEPDTDFTPVSEAALALFEKSLSDLTQARSSEGNRLREMIEQRCSAMDEIVNRIKQRRPEVVNAMREKLQSRIAELNVDYDKDRFEQEIVFMLQKMDVDEELDRMQSHLVEVKNIFERDEPVGRRLDFLMQEFNREANTLCSKSSDIETTQAAVELKVLIEQMREQVQNIE